ncbi:hypothetical protein K9M50_00370 [Patescibacteria group bacterium]|nr:hypothetical protein [Patescibacteria group bacterium]
MVNETKNIEQIPLNESPEKDNQEKESFVNDKEAIKKPEKQEDIQKSQEKEEKEKIQVKDDVKKSGVRVGQDLVSNAQKERMKKIDKILSEDMGNIFLNLSKDKQKEFKSKGESTVVKVNELMQKAKVKVNKIIKLIKEWLGVIPDANKYYLEQEAKIKADKILKLKNKR